VAQYRLGFIGAGRIGLERKQNLTSFDTLREMSGRLMRYAGIDQRSDESARRRADTRAEKRGGQPTAHQ
jgi:hypothetical protein